MKKLLLFISALLFGIQAEACRFTIREIGYSNLFLEQYKLMLYADSSMHKELIDDFKSIAFAYSLDANVDYVFASGENTAPNIRFLSEEGRELYNSKVENADDVINSITECFTSPLRKQLMEWMGESFAFVLYFEGEKNAEDYDEVINSALERFNKISSNLDKAVTEEIKVIKIAFTDRDQEEVVLESLGATANGKQPLVAMIYGRGRLAGKSLVAKDITPKNIFNKLVLMGTDCECGIDLSPLLERALPLSWSNEVRQETAKMLGFDVDNPMILAEMSRILAKGAANNQGDVAPFTPDIFNVKKDATEEVEKDNGNINEEPFSNAILIAVVFAVLVLAAGVVVYFRKR